MSPYLAIFLLIWVAVLGNVLVEGIAEAYNRSPRVKARRIAKLLENDR